VRRDSRVAAQACGVKWNYGTGERVSQLVVSRSGLFPFWNGAGSNFQNSFVVGLIAENGCQKNLASKKVYLAYPRQNFRKGTTSPSGSHH